MHKRAFYEDAAVTGVGVMLVLGLGLGLFAHDLRGRQYALLIAAAIAVTVYEALGGSS